MVELDGLTRNYGERAALAGVTLALAASQTLVVFGPNGAGKTTLLRVLATLLRPHTPHNTRGRCAHTLARRQQNSYHAGP